MILKQYYLGCLAHASYLLGDEDSSTAIIVDPQRDIQPYLDDAQKFGLQIRHVFLTHFHADFVAGHLELRDRRAATIHLRSRAQAEYAFVAMKDGDTLEFPGLRLQVAETPATPSSPSRFWPSISRRTPQTRAPSSPETLCLSETLAAPTCGLRSGGQPTT